MRVFDNVVEQVQSVGLPVVAVSLTAIPCANTPALLMVHRHGFARPLNPRFVQTSTPREAAKCVPGSALQLSDTWLEMEHLDDAMLQAAWQPGSLALGTWCAKSGAAAIPLAHPSARRWSAAKRLPRIPSTAPPRNSCWRTPRIAKR